MPRKESEVHYLTFRVELRSSGLGGVLITPGWIEMRSPKAAECPYRDDPCVSHNMVLSSASMSSVIRSGVNKCACLGLVHDYFRC